MALVRYLLVGIANTIVGLGTIYSVMYFLQLKIVYANALGYTVGVLVSFVLNKKWTFKSDDHFVSSLLRFLLVLAVAYAANLGTVLFSVSKFAIDPYIAQALGIIPYTAIGYLGSHYFAFQKKRHLLSHHEQPVATKLKTSTVINRAIDLSIVVPCYNEEEVLAETTRQLGELFHTLVAENKITNQNHQS